MPTVQLLTTVEFLLTEICWNFFDLPRTRFWILLYSVVSAGLWLKPSGARLVWSSFNEGSDKGNDERAVMRLHDLSQLLAFYTLLRWPQTPCHQAHTWSCACHVLLSFHLCRCVDPVRFSLIVRSPMAYGADVVLQQFAFINAAALRNGISFLAEQTLFPRQSTAREKGSLQILQCQGIGGSTGQRNRIWAFWSSLAYFFDLSTAVELYAVHGLHGIDVAHLETTTSLLLSHLTHWLLIGPKQCNSKRRQSWALHTETLSTTKEYPCCSLKSDNRCGKDSYAVPTVQLLTTVEFLLTEICWNFFDLPRTGFWMFIFCCFCWSVAQAKWRTACVKFLQWRFWQGEWWKSIDEAPWLESALGLLYLVTLATDPLSPSSHMSLCLPWVVVLWFR